MTFGATIDLKDLARRRDWHTLLYKFCLQYFNIQTKQEKLEYMQSSGHGILYDLFFSYSINFLLGRFQLLLKKVEHTLTFFYYSMS